MELSKLKGETGTTQIKKPVPNPVVKKVEPAVQQPAEEDQTVHQVSEDSVKE